MAEIPYKEIGNEVRKSIQDLHKKLCNMDEKFSKEIEILVGEVVK
jgi:hypothetical protein